MDALTPTRAAEPVIERRSFAPGRTLKERLMQPRGDFDPKPILDVIRGLAEIHGNGDGLCEDEALAAASEGRPAFWTSANYSQASQARCCTLANMGSLEHALAECVQSHVPAVLILVGLIPLNPQAVTAMRRAYDAATAREAA